MKTDDKSEEMMVENELPNIKWKVLESKGSENNIPNPRFKHQSFIRNNILYIYGGCSMELSEAVNEPLDLYSTNLNRSFPKWEKNKLKCSNKIVETLSGQCGTWNDDKWFMFGGVNS